MSNPTVCANWRSPTIPDECSRQSYVFLPVKTLTEIRNPSRNHGYVLPNNDVYVLSHDAKKLVLLTHKCVKDPEVVAARDSERYGVFESVDARLEHLERLLEECCSGNDQAPDRPCQLVAETISSTSVVLGWKESCPNPPEPDKLPPTPCRLQVGEIGSTYLKLHWLKECPKPPIELIAPTLTDELVNGK